MADLRQDLLWEHNTSDSVTATTKSAITNLTVTALKSPLAVDAEKPDFAWRMQSNVIGMKQVSYHLIVAKDAYFTHKVWDSGTVQSDKSLGVVYGSTGDTSPLSPETDYFWRVDITDNKGGNYFAESTFSTGLMNPDISAWEGAQWIGSKEMGLDAPSAMLFHINTKFRIVKGNKVSLIFGANDFRLNDKFQNVENVEGENYVRWELDISGVGKEEGAIINFYRIGYGKGDNSNVPYRTISLETTPTTNINKIITNINARKENTLDIIVEANRIMMRINGEQVVLSKGPDPISTFVSPAGPNGGHNTFPNLNSIGFFASSGEKVEFIDYRLVNPVQDSPITLFNATTGATYAIFDDMEGVSVSGNKIIVENAVFGYADPSYYGSLSMLRTEFATDNAKTIVKAKMYITAMGTYEMYINGSRMGEDWFNPGMSQYRETLTYHVYDVTKMIDKGQNAIGAIVGPGFYTGYMTYMDSKYNFFGDNEALLARLVITYSDGSKKAIVTNTDTWKLFNKGPVESADMFQGQRYNANRENQVKGWQKVGYSARGWKTPDVIQPRDWIDFDIVARRDNPVKEVERLKAVRVLQTHSVSGTTNTYDMNVNMVGVPSVTIPKGSLNQGDVVILRFAEEIYPGNNDSPNKATSKGVAYKSLYGKDGSYRPGVAGRILQETYRAALVTDFYIASKEDETRDVLIEPHFTYRGYRYIQITLPSCSIPLPLSNVEGIVLSSEPLTGDYVGVTTDDSGELVNQLYYNIRRSQLGNFFSIPTDCPQRNERMGWTGDAQAYSRTATYNGNVQSFLRQWMLALRNDQGIGGEDGAPAGGIGTTVPAYTKTRDKVFTDCTTWAAAVCMVPWQLYTQYGDIEAVKENFQAMKAWLDGMNYYTIPGYKGLSSKTSGLADWLSIDGRTSSDICNNAIYLYMIEITSIMADAIGESHYAKTLNDRHAIAIESFNKAYVDPDTGLTRSISLEDGSVVDFIDSQTSYATPLNFNVFSDSMKVESGECAGMTYKEFAAKRLNGLAVNPSSSGNEGSVTTSYHAPLERMFAGNTENPTENSLAYTITTGFSGTPNILPALSRTGYVETAYKMITCTDFASWLYPVKMGATSMWERWNSYELAFQMNGNSIMNSFNHFALGAVGSWIYEYHLGITTDSASGYQNFVLQPMPGGTYISASGTYSSNYGDISSSWTADKGKLLTYDFVIPANTTATVYLPIKESVVKGFSPIEGLRYIDMEQWNGIQTAKFEASSGGYHMIFENDSCSARIRDEFVGK